MRTTLRSQLPALPSLGLALALGACVASTPKPILSAKNPVELRAMQARAFDTADRNKMVRTVVATLLDMGYVIDKVEPAAGTVSATKLAQLQLTATVSPRNERQTVVRANAMVKVERQETQVDDPVFYQTLFFEPLSKALFLDALTAEESPLPQTPIPPKG